MNVFDKILVWDENDLDDDFREKWKHVLTPNVRGYGYWVWKPYIILKALKELPEGGILLYLDAGCHLNNHAQKKLEKYFLELITDKLGVKAFPVSRLKKRLELEKNWTKGDVFNYLACRKMKEITLSAQIEATHILCKKCASSVQFINKWYDIIEKNYSLVTDKPSISHNFPDFIEHRHDQSIFSVLFKMNGGVCFNHGETTPDIYTNPIWACRDRWGEKQPLKRRVKTFLKNHIKYIYFKLRDLFH